MMTNKITSFLVLFSFAITFSLTGQEHINGEKRIYVSEDGKTFVNRDLPVYIKIATSPDDTAPAHSLKSKTSGSYTNPMYFDTEGYNTIRSPWAVDPETKKPVYPQQEVIFEVYADGIAPLSKALYNDSRPYHSGGKTYYNSKLNVEIAASDEVSGVQRTYYSINGEPFKEYINPLAFSSENEYNLKYYSIDFTGNTEELKHSMFSVDATPPKTEHTIEGITKDNILSPDAAIILTSEDNLSGVKKIMYAINEGPYQLYSRPISMAAIEDEEFSIHYYAIDNVMNEEEKQVIDATAGKMRNGQRNDESMFSYYIDNDAPSTRFSIEGDQHEEKYLYISGRSRIVVEASDEKSGVENIYYGINNANAGETYTDPFTLDSEGLNKIYYKAVDYVGNNSGIKGSTVFVDTKSPETKISFQGNQFTNRDTIFITSATKINISGTDNASGLKKIRYRLSDGTENDYTESFTIDKNGSTVIQYHGIDKVNNAEAGKQQIVFVDNISPNGHYHFSVEPIGKKTVRDESYTIYPSNTTIYLGATDNACGVKEITYEMNDTKTVYTEALAGLKPGNYEILVTNTDELGNASEYTLKFAIEN
ncbi:MAG: OmpL47-type beta-barrel domain-containing protein [Bacteroidota bacterium]